MFFTRTIEKKIAPYLGGPKIIMMTGSRQTGKTTLLQHFYEQIIAQGGVCTYLSLEDNDVCVVLNEHPKHLFSFSALEPSVRNYFFIDEIQYLKNPTNFLKYLYDTHHDEIQLIVTGSSSFYLDRHFLDSLVGRVLLFDIYTLTREEFIGFNQRQDIISAMASPNKLSPVIYRDVEVLWNEFVTYGGYPEIVLTKNFDEKKFLLKQYIRQSIKKDIFEGGIEMSDKYMHLLKLLAAQQGKLVNANELSNVLGISAPTLQKYLLLMQKCYHIGFIKPFYNSIRKEIIKMPKVYFYDSGLRNSVLDTFEPIIQRTDKGEILEQIARRSFLSTYQSEEIRYWRNKLGQEVDFIIQQKQAFEIKRTEKLFHRSASSSFFSLYPDMPFSILTYDDLLKKVR